ncbi:MAG: flagellar hook assembly protein FlgD [Desulfopila sp.]
MSSISDIFGQSSVTNSSSTTQKQDKASMGKEDFLSLLVAQMKNQDPLNPDDPTQFTTQLAQFSQLEQMFNMNGNLESLVSSYQGSEKLTAIGTIGKEVAFAADTLTYDGGSAKLGYQLDGQAASVTLTLRKDGTTVANISANDLSAGNHYIDWNGLSLDGSTAQPGTYTLIVDARDASGMPVRGQPVVRELVTGADLDSDNGGKLLTRSGEIDFDSILGVFEAG